MTSIETAASYATSPDRLHANQWKVAEAPEPLTPFANQVLQALRTTGQYMGAYAILNAVGAGTPGDVRRAIKELDDRGLLEPTPKAEDPKPGKGQEQPQEPAQEPSTPAPAPEGAEQQPTPQEPASGDLLGDLQATRPDIIRDAVIEKAEEAPAYPDVPHELQLGTGPITGVYPTLAEAVSRAEEYILTMEYPWAYVAMVRVLGTDGREPGPWLRVRDPREPSATDSALSSR